MSMSQSGLSDNSTNFSFNDSLKQNIPNTFNSVSSNKFSNHNSQSNNNTMSQSGLSDNSTIFSLDESLKQNIPNTFNSVSSNKFSNHNSLSNNKTISSSSITNTNSSSSNSSNISFYETENIVNNKANSIDSSNSIDLTNSTNRDNSVNLSFSHKSIKSIQKDSIPNSIFKEENFINNKIFIDVAVLCQEYTNITSMCDDNIINLDEINISQELFQSIFYPYHENFGMNKSYVLNHKDYLFPYISFLPEFRKVNKKQFYLLEEIISNIERNLNISRNCFTKESLVELTKEMINIQSLSDINCCSVLSSLTWNNILEIIKNYKLIKPCFCMNKENCKCVTIIPICVINIIFKTPTIGVKDTIIRFNYRITDL